MDDARFWSVVAALGPEFVPARLAMVLNSLTPADLDGFCVCLDKAEAKLDTTAHRAQASAAYEISRDEDGNVEQASDERIAEFHDLQATVVAHGVDTWRAVVAVPLLLSGGWPTGLGRQFVAAVAEAVRRSFRTLQPA